MTTVAQLELFDNENLLDDEDSFYCENCLVIPIQPYEKYCLGCADEVCSDLAARA